MSQDFSGVADARRYVNAVLASAIEDDLTDRNGWIRGGLAYKDDLLAVREARKLIDSLRAKAERG